MKYYIIAGEASGDLHGSNLIKALKNEDQGAEFRIWGGELMEQAGGVLIKHYRDLAFMGFLEVVKNLGTILKNIKFCKTDILSYRPDVLVLIDYPGFNLRIAKWAKSRGIKVIYYISPQVWAWHSSRVHGIKKSIDRMFVILPFEKAFYKKYNCEVDFVGHPLLDVIDSHPKNVAFRKRHGLDTRPIIALLPGSRKQEISRMLKVMLSIIPAFPAYQFVIAGAPAIPKAFYDAILDSLAKNQKREEQDAPVKLLQNLTYDLLQHARAALVTSGTATLETALFKVPQIVCYRGNKLSYLIARKLVNVAYIALVNLILGRPLIKELIQDDLSTNSLEIELNKLFSADSDTRFSKGYEELREKLGSKGASVRAAERMLKYLRLRAAQNS